MKKINLEKIKRNKAQDKEDITYLLEINTGKHINLRKLKKMCITWNARDGTIYRKLKFIK